MSSRVQHKLLAYEVIPPPVIWDKITAELNTPESYQIFPSTLYNAEVTPPISTWNKIQITLNAEREAATPVRKSYLPFLRFGAAAIFIGLVAWGGIQLLNKKSGNIEIAAKEEVTPFTKDSGASIPLVSPEKNKANSNAFTVIIDPDEAKNDAALEASKRTFAKLDISPVNRKLKNIAAAYRFAFSEQTDIYPVTISQSAASPAVNADRYIMVLNPEGNNVRISKKLSHLVCCVSGDDETRDCKDQMSIWREKIACSTLGHSTGGFLDILNLLNSYQEQ
ncbi:MAG TPA: hypothetical protein VN451_07630 [Chitinophagaceae bacterium]|nr:hypothetical protein [Chitinophagaceae bacterium]